MNIETSNIPVLQKSKSNTEKEVTVVSSCCTPKENASECCTPSATKEENSGACCAQPQDGSACCDK